MNNSEDAARLRERAENYMNEGNIEEALRFLQRSNELYPSDEVQGKEKHRKILQIAEV